MEMECPICLDEAKAPLSLECHHVFCATCILKWCTSQRARCPVCSRAAMCLDKRVREEKKFDGIHFMHPFSEYGLWLSLVNGRLVVEESIEEGQACISGIRPGDTIYNFDGTTRFRKISDVAVRAQKIQHEGRVCKILTRRIGRRNSIPTILFSLSIK